MLGIREKFNKLGIKNPFYFIVLSIILTAVFFLQTLNTLKYYQSEISILFIPKSERVTLQSEQIIQNIVELPKQLSFYERVLTDSGNILNQFSEYPKDEQKRLWNKQLRVSRVKNSGVIKIKVLSKNKSDSATINKQAALTLFNSVSQYYNVKEDIDLRIIDGPITNSFLKNLYLIAIFSLIGGIVVAYILAMIFYGLQKIFITRKNTASNKSVEKRDSASEITIPEAVGIKKYQAPTNLPVAKGAEYEIAEDVMEDSFLVAPEPAEDIAPDQNKEPTEEEFKKRLNQLLKGGL